MNKSMLIALLTALLFVGLYVFAQTSPINIGNDLEQNAVVVSPTLIPTPLLIESTIPVPSEIETERKNENSTSFLTCDTDRDCALGAVCREINVCPPCLTDENKKPVGDCQCTTVKKCEPK